MIAIRLSAAGALALGALLAPGLTAAGLPDWAAALAAGAPAVPEGLADAPARTLLSETRIDVRPDGTLRVRRRVAAQALRRSADEVGLGFFHFDEAARILHSRAWHVDPEGKVGKTRSAAAVDVAPGDIFLSDRRTRVLRVDGIDKGSLVFFEFEADETPDTLTYLHAFFEDAPTAVSRFVLDLPADWSLRYAWLRAGGAAPTVEGTTRTWELRDLAPGPPDSLRPSPWNTAPILVLALQPPPDTRVAPVAFSDWTSLARWWEELAAKRADPTPAVEAVARGLADAGSDLPARLLAAGVWVRDSVRYVAKEIGIGNYRPRFADGVLQTLWGDCKDKGTLLRALLASLGIDSYPILIHATLPDTVAETVPAPSSFDHFVVGVPLPAGAELPPRLASAIVETPTHGRLLVIDATNEYAAIGSLPAALAGKMGLLVAGERSSLVSMPAADPSAHRIERRMEADVAAGGATSIRLTTRRFGEPAALARVAWVASARDYRQRATAEIERLWPGAVGGEIEVTVEDDDGAFVEQLSIELPAPDGTAASPTLALFPGALDDLPRVSLRKRSSAVGYDYARTLRFSSEIRGVDPASLPATERSGAGAGWSVAADWGPAAGGVRGSWAIELARLRFDPDAFGELDEFWTAARRATGVLVPRP